MNSILGQALLGDVVLAGLDSGGSGSVYVKDGSSSLSLSDSLTTNQHIASASDMLSITDEATNQINRAKQATSALSLTDDARASIFIVSASDTLTLTDASRVPDTYTLTASSPFTITSTIAVRPNRVSASDILVFTSIADHHIKVRDATDVLFLDDSVVLTHAKNASNELDLQQLAVQGVVNLTVTSALELASTARNKSILERVPHHTLTLDNTAVSSIKMLTAATSIELVDNLVAIVPWYADATSELIETTQVYDVNLGLIDEVTGLQDSASATHTGSSSAHSIISFATQAQRYVVLSTAMDEDAESVLSLTDSGRTSLQEEPSNSLSLDQSASAQLGTPITSELDSLDSTASVRVSYGTIQADGTISIEHSVAFVLEQADTLCTYSPFVGGGDGPTMPGTYEDGEHQSFVVLEYPASGSPTDSVTLRAPNLGDRYRLGTTRINRETRGGTLEVFASSQWPKIKTLVLSFSSLSYADGQALLAFMADYAGQDVKLTDWEGKEWTGVIMTPDDPVVQDGPGCDYTASFEMEVEAV